MIRVDLDNLYYGDYFYDIFKKRKKQIDLSKIDDWLKNIVETGEIGLWCEENIIGSWKFDIKNSSIMQLFLTYFYFEFELEEDAVAFKLRWA